MDNLAFTEMSKSEKSHWWFVGRRYFIQRRLQKLIDKNNNILEVGCGTGGNLEMLKAFGKVFAIETNKQAYDFSKRIKNVESAIGALPNNNPFSNKKFNIIALFDVLEHIEDDLLALQSLNKCLEKDGKIIITVPAYMFMWSRHDEYHHHFRRYTRQSLCQLCEQADYKVEFITAFNTILLPIAIIIRLLSKLSSNDKPLQTGGKNKMVNGILKFFFKAETALNNARGWPLGLSIYAELKVK